ncbi:ABC transporter substrate-binding protein [Herbiconiux moechotypicola]|uniref:Nitrate ABC transporter substrate-binding protein n=1 Tax=Herbiconiux moechotypicola TaxID=637393 RepID=A0ABN3DL40_9MICO|nr:ABC transporter substrate-binding protein [Herbiconiux moechotypicola]MCS5730100.1 ABC transporter substrate-binding protein [Herbiconiux moechotypicola]
MRHARLLALAPVTVAAIALSGCSSSGTASQPSATAAVGAVDLSGVCPSTVIVQTDWNPEAEHGHLYQLLGPNPAIDASKKAVSGPLYSGGEFTGVDIEIRAGGPAIGFQSVSSQLYTDPDIMLGYVSTDESIQQSTEMPTVAVFAPLDISPQMIMWDPESYPGAETIADIVADGATIRYFEGSAYMEYLKAAGIVPENQADGSYDGTPASFVAAQGASAQQGFASAEPYIYEHEIADWMKPVAYSLVNDSGYTNYMQTVSVRADALEEDSACLSALVPVLQQASVDYYADPDATNALIIDLVEQYDTGWVYSHDVADYSVATQLELGLAGNGDDETLGDFDLDRVNDLLEKVTPVFATLGTAPADGLTADDLVTNEFIDPSIGLPVD